MSADTIKDRCDLFVQLLATYENRLASFVLALVPNWTDADDIIQETKLRLWEQFDTYDPKKDFGVWACVIARYQVLAFRTRSARSRVMFSQEIVERLAQAVAQTDAESDARLAYLEECVKKLTQWQRELLSLCCTAGYSSEEVARRLGRKADAIRQALVRIRRKLYRCIEEARQEAEQP